MLCSWHDPISDSGNLGRIKATKLPRELQPIALSVNRLMTRLRAALEAEREFTSNSAHELRTPIAEALAQTQMLIAELEVPGNQDPFAIVLRNLIENALVHGPPSAPIEVILEDNGPLRIFSGGLVLSAEDLEYVRKRSNGGRRRRRGLA